MRKILIATHSDMGKGMLKTIQFLTSLDNLYAIDAYTGAIPFEKQVEQFFMDVKEEDDVVVLTDMQGGSVNQKFCEYKNDRTHVICGVNLPLAFTIALYPQNETITSEIITNWIKEAKQQIQYMNTYETICDGDDE